MMPNPRSLRVWPRALRDDRCGDSPKGHADHEVNADPRDYAKVAAEPRSATRQAAPGARSRRATAGVEDMGRVSGAQCAAQEAGRRRGAPADRLRGVYGPVPPAPGAVPPPFVPPGGVPVPLAPKPVGPVPPGPV